MNQTPQQNDIYPSFSEDTGTTELSPQSSIKEQPTYEDVQIDTPNYGLSKPRRIKIKGKLSNEPDSKCH